MLLRHARIPPRRGNLQTWLSLVWCSDRALGVDDSIRGAHSTSLAIARTADLRGGSRVEDAGSVGRSSAVYFGPDSGVRARDITRRRPVCRCPITFVNDAVPIIDAGPMSLHIACARHRCTPPEQCTELRQGSEFVAGRRVYPARSKRTAIARVSEIPKIVAEPLAQTADAKELSLLKAEKGVWCQRGPKCLPLCL